MEETNQQPYEYSEDNIRTLQWNEHIRLRPGMYIGKLGNGDHQEDGIYVLLKEVIDNSVDEFMMGFGKTIEVTVGDGSVTVRDYGRGIPLGSVRNASSVMNTGAKYDSKAFKKSVGLNGVGIKAVNALSTEFRIRSVRNGEVKEIIYCKGNVVEDREITPCDEPDGTSVAFTPDASLFEGYAYKMEFVEQLVNAL